MKLAPLCSLALLSFGCRITPPRTDKGGAAEGDDSDSGGVPPAVILVVLDGVRAEESLGDRTSSATGEEPWEMLPRVWEELVPLGARATGALNLGVTITATAHCDILSGRRQAIANYPVNDEPGVYRPELPTLAEALRDQAGLSADQVVVMGNTVLIEPVTHSLWPGYGGERGAEFRLVEQADAEGRPATYDDEVVAGLLSLLEEQRPRFVLVNFHAADRAGHDGDADDYPEQVRALDEMLVSAWNKLQANDDYRDNTYLVVVSDHGRHRVSDDDPAWRNHGDQCLGCRHVPLLVLGPGVNPGSYGEPLLLSDVAPTLAAAMDLELPWADGRVAAELFADGAGFAPGRSGVADLAVAGSRVASSIYQDDPARRSRVEVDGVTLSSADAFAAEAPALSADGEWLCFREIAADLDAADAIWTPRCFRDGGGSWAEIPAPEEAVNPFWQPALLPDGSGLVAVYAFNPNGHPSIGGPEGDAGLRVRRFDGESWGAIESLVNMTFPDGAAGLDLGGRQLVAVAAGPADEDGRHDRRLRLAIREEAGLGISVPVELEGLAPGEKWRVERPALAADGDGTLWVAAVGYSEPYGATSIVLARSADGAKWEEVRRIDLPAAPLPHLAPRWTQTAAGLELVYAALQPDQSAAICRATPAGEPRCLSVDSPRILDLEVDGGAAWVVRDAGVGQWEAERYDLAGW